MITVPEMQGVLVAESAPEPALAVAQPGHETDAEIAARAGDSRCCLELPDAERAERRVLGACGAW